jgi:hypothetical protein
VGGILGIKRCHELLVRQAGLSLGLDRLAEGDIGQVLRTLKFIELGHLDEDGRRLTMLGQHNPLVIALRTGNKLVKLVTRLWQRKREHHTSDSTQPPDAARNDTQPRVSIASLRNQIIAQGSSKAGADHNPSSSCSQVIRSRNGSNASTA